MAVLTIRNGGDRNWVLKQAMPGDIIAYKGHTAFLKLADGSFASLHNGAVRTLAEVGGSLDEGFWRVAKNTTLEL